MRRRGLVSFFILGLGTSLFSQANYRKNPFQFHTHWYWVWGGMYPNFKSNKGNQKDDAVWRIYSPDAVMNGYNRMSIIEWGGAHWIFDDVSKPGYTGNTMPDEEFRKVKRSIAGVPVPDFSKAGLFGRFSPGKIKFSGKGPGAYWVKYTIANPSNAIKVTTREGYAFVRKAVPGEKFTGSGRPTSGVGYVLSALEIFEYGLPQIFSGNYNSLTKRFYFHDDVFSGAGYGILYQWNSILEPSAVNWHQFSVKGRPNNYDEGIGAYYSCINLHGGDIRWHFHHTGKPGTSYFAAMFANINKPRVAFPLPGGHKIMLLPVDPAFTLFVSMGFFGTFKRAGNGWASWETPVVRVPVIPELRGKSIWVAAVFFDPTSFNITGVSPTLRTRFF